MRIHHWALIAGVALAGGLALRAEAKDPPKVVVIKGCQKTKPPVTFPHELHVKKNKIECKTCHHKEADTPCSSSKCHASNGGKAEGKRPGCAEMSPLKNPFHIRCVGCHKQKISQSPKAPTKCVECHKP